MSNGTEKIIYGDSERHKLMNQSVCMQHHINKIPKQIVVSDLDDTISNASWRAGLIKECKEQHDWDQFHAGIIHDPPIYNNILMLSNLHTQDIGIIFVTGRPFKHHKLTIQWLSKHNVPWHMIMYRENNDIRPAHVIKKECVEYLTQEKQHIVLFVIDDDQRVIETLNKKYNIPCIHFVSNEI